jgi:pimeloyl-ACP methyl ester carboxylesterase
VPIVSSAPGTIGIGDSCAASRNPLVSAVMTPPAFLQKGYAVAITDYEGLGTPGTHTYVVGLSEGHAVIDAARAAQRLGLGLSASAPIGFFGYSQGGGGAAWAGQLAASYAPELNVKGTAAGGIPADMVKVGQALDGGIGFGFLAAAAVGFNAAYPELNLDKYLNATGRQLFEDNIDKCVDSVILNFGLHKIAEYTTTNPMLQPDWQARLRENSLGAVAPSAPIFIWHGLFDEILPYEQDAALWKTYCRKGAKVTFEATFDEHVSGMVGQGGTDAVTFLSDRLSGKPATDNCWLSGA